MRDFKSGGRSRDRRNSPKRSFGGGNSRRPLLYDAVCDECGKDCQVPFKPSGGKPVYCSDCFEKKGGGDRNRPSGSGSGRRGFDDRGRGRSPQSDISDRGLSQLVENIKILNVKLDKIIDLLSSAGEKKPESVEDKTKKSKKSTTRKADKAVEVPAPVEKKDTKKAKEKGVSLPETELHGG